jgi:hypothetical protein
MSKFEDSLSLAEKVMYGIDIGIDTNTAADYLCLVCLSQKKYVTMFEADGTLYCPTHHNEMGRSYRHKKEFPEYREPYAQELEHRLLQEETMSNDKNRELAVRQVSPVMPSKREKEEMMANVLNAGLVTSEKFGVYTDMAREYLAVVGLTCGLSPHLGEIMVWPNIKTVDGQEKIMGIVTFLSAYGYLRKANEQAALGNDFAYAEDDCHILSPEEVEQRKAHWCYACNGSGKFGRSGKCYKCDGKGKFKPADVIVVKRSIYLRRQAALSKEIGVTPKPVSAYGVAQPGDFNIPSARDLISRVELRGLKAVLKLGYSIDFYIPAATPDLLEHYVEGAEMAIDDNGDIIDGEAHVVESVEPPPAETEPVEEEEQVPLLTIEQLGFDEVIPKSQEGVDLQGDVMARLKELGYLKGKPQINLIHALWGKDVNWKTISGGQLYNTLVYASKANNQPKDVKDTLKEECREKTEAGEFWL